MSLGMTLLLLAILVLLAASIYFVWRRITPAVVKDLTRLLPDARFVDLGDGGRIHYVQAGKGADLVLLHGIGASVYVWRLLFPLLQGRYRVTAFDLPGFGLSSKDRSRNLGLDSQSSAISEACSKIGIKKATLVGSSMGGAIALWMAKLEPARFERVVALAPATDSSAVPAAIRYFAVATPLLRRAMNHRTMKVFVKRVVARQDLVTDEVVAEYLKPFQHDEGSGVRAFWSATTVLSDRRLPRDLAALEVPTLIVYGSRDLLVTRRSIDRLVKVIPGAKLIVNEEAGHHIMEDDPAWTAKTIETFVAVH